VPVTIRAARSGLSLAEVVVVMILLGLVGAAIGSAILNQQRFHRDASALLHARQGVRDAMEVLSTDIRGASSLDTIRLMADSALELFAAVGASVACRTTSGSVITLAAESAVGNTLTSFLVAPDTGDLALVFRNTGDVPGGRWERHRIAGFAARADNPGCLSSGSAPGDAFAVALHAQPDPPVPPGTPVRFVRRGRYSLYRSSDGRWYLGYRRCNALGASVCGSIQPLSGPYRSYSTDQTRTGFLFEYFDSQGDRVEGGSAMSVARIDITARSESSRAGSRAGGRSLPQFATASVAIRNRGP